jgi:hypothetical protein
MGHPTTLKLLLTTQIAAEIVNRLPRIFLFLQARHGAQIVSHPIAPHIQHRQLVRPIAKYMYIATLLTGDLARFTLTMLNPNVLNITAGIPKPSPELVHNTAKRQLSSKSFVTLS